MKPIILFDLDGTLIDSTEAILESFHNSFDIHKLEHPMDEAIKSLIGHPLDIMYKELGIDDTKIWDIVATYKEHYRTISKMKTELLPFEKQTVEEAARFARLGIVTTKTGKYSQELMEHFKLMSHFEVLIGREHVQMPKPHAEPVLKALDAMCKQDKHVWLIGDTHMDILSAKSAGIDHIAVTSGYETLAQLQQHTSKIKNSALDAVREISKIFV